MERELTCIICPRGCNLNVEVNYNDGSNKNKYNNGYSKNYTIIVKGNNCPICANQKILKGYNDVETLRPELAKIWHPTKNGEKVLSDFHKCSEEKVWWKCENGHEFCSTIYARYVAKNLCSYCYKYGKRK